MAVAVLTRSYDNTRSGANTQEAGLHPDVVARGLRKLFSLQLDAGDDPRLEAQPMIVPGVKMGDGTTHTVAYVCTMANNVYAFDADTGAKLWPKPVNLGTPINGSKSIKNGNNTIDFHRINLLWGILSTPVVDLDTQTMYVVSWSIRDGSAADTVDPKNGPNNTIHRLHTLNLADGSHRPNSPVEILPTVTAKDGSKVQFMSVRQKQRLALLLVPLRQGGGARSKRPSTSAAARLRKRSRERTAGWWPSTPRPSVRPGRSARRRTAREPGFGRLARGPLPTRRGMSMP